jgi:hypothetical protein
VRLHAFDLLVQGIVFIKKSHEMRIRSFELRNQISVFRKHQRPFNGLVGIGFGVRRCRHFIRLLLAMACAGTSAARHEGGPGADAYSAMKTRNAMNSVA